jgi:tRNA dimethylallyltransferase
VVTKPAKPILIAIVGETASGKSALALDLAEKYNGEIICADSRTVYQGMDIGTAKPTLEDQDRIPHHLLDIGSPDQRFTAADFKVQAEAAIQNITRRNKLPFLVGGTGLYVDSVLFDFEFGGKADEALRAELEVLDNDELQKRATQLGISPDTVNFQNRRHLVRAIERGGMVVQKKLIRSNSLVIGLSVEREKLEERIRLRINEQLKDGLEEEVERLVKHYGWQCEALSAIGYKEWQGYFAGEQTLQQTEDLLYKHTVQYAKRQRTWFKRNNEIQWAADKKQADRLIGQFLLQ